MAEPSGPRPQLDTLTPKQRKRLQTEIEYAHSQLTDPKNRGKGKFLGSLEEHPDRQLFMDAYMAKYLESPQDTYRRVRDEARTRRPVAPVQTRRVGGHRDAMESLGHTGPDRNPRKILGYPLPTNFDDRKFSKLTPDVQDEVAAEIAIYMNSDIPRRVACEAWLEGRPALRTFYLDKYGKPQTEPIINSVGLSFDRNEDLLMDQLRRMVPQVRKHYMYQIHDALHGEDEGAAAECRSWLIAVPKLKAVYERKFGAKVGKAKVIDSTSAPAPLMKPPGPAFLKEFLRLTHAPEIFVWDNLHDKYPLAVPYIEKVTPALCEMLKGNYGREVRTTITDRDDSSGKYVTHKKLRAAMKRYIKLTYTDPGERAALLAKLENNLWIQPRHD